MTKATTDFLEMTTAAARLMNDYFFGLDDRDLEKAVACFTDEVESSYGGIDLPPGRDAVIEYLRGALGGVRSTRHLATSSRQVLTKDGGRVKTHAIAYVVLGHGDTGKAQIRGISYDDELVKSAAGWLVARRVHSVEWSITSSVTFISSGEDGLAQAGARATGTR
jgi:hypothetical protein